MEEEAVEEEAPAQRSHHERPTRRTQRSHVTSISRANGWRQVKLDHGSTVAVRKMHLEELSGGERRRGGGWW